MDTIHIDSQPLYPKDDGTASAKRRYSDNYPAIGNPWPEIAVGQQIEVYDQQGWIWPVEVVSLDGEEKATVKILGDRRPQPFPSVSEDGYISLPNMSGHAHLRNWKKGDIVKINDRTYSVRSEKYNRNTGRVDYKVEEVPPEKYATRPGRIRMPNDRTARAAIGSCVQNETTGEWLHVKKVEKVRFGSAIGYDFIWYVAGNYVSAEKAEKINALHPSHLNAALKNASSVRSKASMPGDAVQVLPKDPNTSAASGTRVSVVGKTIFYEQAGDPDQIDSWYHYVSEITDPDLLKRVQQYIKKTSK